MNVSDLVNPDPPPLKTPIPSNRDSPVTSSDLPPSTSSIPLPLPPPLPSHSYDVPMQSSEHMDRNGTTDSFLLPDIKRCSSPDKLVDTGSYDSSRDTPMSHVATASSEITTQPKGESFPFKLWRLIHQPNFADVFSWSAAGDCFSFRIGPGFQMALASHFRSSSPDSFIRQLNAYGFMKKRAPQGMALVVRRGAKSDHVLVYSHPYFQRNRPDLLTRIVRHGVISAASSVAASLYASYDPNELAARHDPSRSYSGGTAPSNSSTLVDGGNLLDGTPLNTNGHALKSSLKDLINEYQRSITTLVEFSVDFSPFEERMEEMDHVDKDAIIKMLEKMEAQQTTQRQLLQDMMLITTRSLKMSQHVDR